MNLTFRGRVYALIALISFIFSYSIITLNFFPHLGFAVSAFIFLIFIYKFKKQKDEEIKIYLTFALLFSSFLFIRSEPDITFLNLAAAVFFGFLMLIPRLEKDIGFMDLIYAPFLFCLKSIITKKSDYYLEFKSKENPKIIKTGEVIFGTLLTAILLAVILPLLSTANPFFQKLVEEIWKLLNLDSILKNFGYETVFIWLIRIIFFLFFIYILPKFLTLINKSLKYTIPISFKTEDLPLLIPKIVLAIVIFVFFITQLQFYFASDITLANIGISHSQRTRDVFGQLTIVSGIILVLIYNAKNSDRFGKVLNWILGVQGIFLALMAYKSVFEYINAWGLTYKRLYGLTLATEIMAIFILYFYYHRKNYPSAWFVKKTIIYSAAILILVNIFNFDYLIYYFEKSKTGRGVDYTYLSTLSPDSLSYKDQYDKLLDANKNNYPLEVYDNENPLIILHKIDALQRKYTEFDLRTLNLLDYLQYQQIKTVETQNLRAYYQNKFNR